MFSLKSGETLQPKLKEYLMKEQKLIEAGKRSRADATKHDAQLSRDCFAERLKEYNHDDEETKDYFHPSAIGQCLRKLFFREFGAPDNGPGVGSDMLKQHLIFEIGTYAHVMLQNLCARAGLLERREFAVRCDKDKLIGHADGILKIDGERPLLEIKTINSRGFEKLTEPKEEHVMQAMLYAGLIKLNSIIFVYFDKNTAALKEYKLPFNSARFTSVLHRIRGYQKNVKNRTLPEREGTNPNKFPCTYCEYSSVCFSSRDTAAWAKTAKVKL